MKRLFLVLGVSVGALLGALVYERLFVEKTFGPAAIFSVAILALLSAALFAMAWFYDTRHRDLIRSLALAAAAMMVTYLALDIATGLILIKPLSPPLVPDQYRHHRMVPNSYSSFQQPDFHYVQRVNNFGMRGQDVAAAKPANSYRILTLGDSFTMGKGVEDNQTFSVLLEEALRKRVAACGADRTIEVLNGGTDSYAPILSYIALTRDLAPLQPDMVILNLDVSDLVQEAAYRGQAVYSDNGDILGVPQGEHQASITERIRTWTERHLFLSRLLLFYVAERGGYRDFTVRSVVEQANFAVAAHTLAGDTEPRDKQWRDIFDSLTRIKKFTDSRGIRFMLSTYPWAHQVSSTEWIPGRYAFMPENAVPSDRSMTTIRELSAANGIELIDLFPVFRDYHGGEPLYFQHDMHWTPAGHQVAAQGLEGYLAGRHLGDWCR